MISEIFRTYVAGILSPTAFLSILLILSSLLLWKNKVRTAKFLLTGATVVFVLLTTSPLRTSLFSLMEVEHNSLPADYDYVVVLGGRIFPNDNHPVSSQITASLLSRLSYGVALTLKKSDSKLIVSGSGPGEVPEAILMKKFALDMGLSDERIIIEQESMNTSQHPVYLKPILKDKKFLIVTSAYHMKRALINFRAHGLEGVPAPTDYMNKDQDGLGLASMIPRGENLSAMDRIFTELYSTIWTTIKMTFN